jgi:hypothetical protein
MELKLAESEPELFLYIYLEPAVLHKSKEPPNTGKKNLIKLIL